MATTYTAADGEFLFYDVADGVYTVLASADGYLTTAPMTATITGGSTANLVMTIQVDSSDGTTTQEFLLASTKTNAVGNYLFGGVAGGEYLVKAKVSQ